MARKQQHAGHENHERWLVSYADFITLLFAFFVVMFASSQSDKARAQQISESVKGALQNGAMRPVVREVLGGTVDDKGKGNAMMKGAGGEAKKKVIQIPELPPERNVQVELAPSMHFLAKDLAAEIKSGKVELKLEPRGLVISLRQAAFFPSGGDEVAANTYESIGKIGETIQHLPNPVLLEGHTDSIPIHTGRFRSNWELSAARSIAMLQLLTTKFHLPQERFGIAGYADSRPIGSNDTAEGRAQNRRVDVVILNQNILVAPTPSMTPNTSKK